MVNAPKAGAWLGHHCHSHELVHAHHEDILVMGSVEDHYLALARRALVGSPEEVVRGLLLAQLLEPIDERSLRVHSAEHMPDGAILAGSVERLEHDQKRLAAVGVEEVLQLVHALDMFLDLGQSLLMRLMLSCVRSIDFR